jgi:hypothetical protein
MSIDKISQKEDNEAKHRRRASVNNERQKEAERTDADRTQIDFNKTMEAERSQKICSAGFNSEQRTDNMLSLQQTYGNKYVQRLIGQEEKTINNQDENSIISRAHSKQGQGYPLPELLRQRAENSLGENLEDVRVHADKESDRMVRQVRALAFTVGKDIFVPEKSFPPGNNELDILAHEVVHTMQQRYGSNSEPEHEADILGQKILNNKSINLNSTKNNPVPVLQRDGSTSPGKISPLGPSTSWFDVTGTLSEVASQLNSRKEWGFCNNKFNRDNVKENKGKITSVDIDVYMDIELPRWTGEGWDKAPVAAREEWNRMLSCLQAHEQKHAKKAVEWAKIIQDRLIGQPYSRLETIWSTGLANHQTAQNQYDAQSRNGQNEGVTLDTSKDPRTTASVTENEITAEIENEYGTESEYENEEVAGVEAESESGSEAEMVAETETGSGSEFEEEEEA